MEVWLVFKLSLFSRLIIFILQIIFNNVIPDHDAGVFTTFSSKHSNSTNLGDKFADILFSGFGRWDAQYFLHIAQFGYSYENTLAFFPLYPILISSVSRFFSAIFGSTLIIYNLNLISGSIVNLVLFILSNQILYSLTFKLFRNVNFSKLSVVFFCFNPASIFFSACYSECLFSFLTFLGLLCLESDRSWPASFVFGLSTITRSNGMISVAFILHHNLKKFIKNSSVTSHVTSTIILFIQFAVTSLCQVVLAITPFVVFQYNIYRQFCLNLLPQDSISREIKIHAHDNNYKLPSDPNKSEWCKWSLPIPYSYIQSKYWDVGFLTYYKTKQIPNFLLAAPIVLLISRDSLEYFRRNVMNVKYLGLIDTNRRNNASNLFVYMVHVVAILFFCIGFVHIQVTTRLLISMSPMFCWILASKSFKIVKSSKVNVDGIGGAMNVLKILSTSPVRSWTIYCGLYFVVGPLLHCNYLPWT